MTSLRRQIIAPVIAAWLSTAVTALAVPTDPAAAEQLFQDGRAAMQAGDHARACEKFEESHRLDPAAGTLTNLAACRESTGELARAWEAWQGALALMRADDPRRPETQRRAQDVAARVPRLKLTAGSRLTPNARVFRDGVELGRASFWVELPVDPGAHSVEVITPGHEPKRYDVQLEEGQRVQLELESGLERPEDAPQGKPKTDSESSSPSAVSGDPSRRGGALRPVGLVAGGLGLTGLALGGVMGMLAWSEQGNMEETCTWVRDTPYCPQPGLDAARSGDRWATIATVATASGAGLLALGAVALVLAPPRNRERVARGTGAPVHDVGAPRPRASLTVTPGIGGGSLVLGGSF